MLQKKIGNDSGEKKGQKPGIWFLSRSELCIKIIHKIVAGFVALGLTMFLPKAKHLKLGRF